MNIKKILASVLCVSIFTLYTPIGALASEISGVNPNGNTYNIEASKVSGSTGFRHYDKFDLSQGDIANLIYKNYDKFVNLVNSQISINGILNTINANGGFFNGHAIFVSPLGMVIGASGVLNVGSLSVLTPSQSSYKDFLNSYNAGNLSDYQYNADKYRGLITASQGDVIVKGKILARNDVNIYGKSISVGDNAVKNSGIVAGWQDTKTVFKEQQLAEKTFNALVSNNITNANSLSLKNGKIVLSATSNPDLSVDDISTASVDVKNTKLVANDVDISANTTMEQVYFKEGRAKVNVENSKIVGDNVSIVANAIANTSKNINLMPPAIWAWLFENEGNISEYFSSKIYNGFSGTRTSANVTIKDSIINATNDINILSKAESSLAVNSDIVSQGGVPQLFYALGTRTNSKINIDNSTLNAKNDVNLNALSKNAIDVKMIDNSDYIFKIKTQDAYHATILKSSTIADTAINITNGSKIFANDFNAKSLAYGTGEFNLTNTATVGKNDFGSSSKGGSGAAFIYFMNDSDTSSEVNIKDSIIETTGNSDISATNLNGNGTWVTIQTTSKGYVKPDTIQDSDGFFKKLIYYLGKAYDKYSSVTTVDMTQMYKNVFGKAQENIAGQVNQNVELGLANFQAGGGVVVNNSTGNAQVNIENSKIKTKDLKIEAYNLDQYYNNSSVSAAATEKNESAIVGAGVAVVVNNHENTSKVSIKNSTINADNVVANAINDLPGNHGHFGISNKYFKLGFDFNASADDAWSFEPVAKLEGESINMVPEFGLFGFFNNFASAASSGDKQAISASIVYNTTLNNADTVIENAIINAKNSFVANAVNAVVARDAVGFLNSDSIINIGSIFDIFNSNGLGGNVIVQKITNNANAKIIGSNIKVENGDLTLASANQQSYLNIATIGGQSEKMTLNGTVNVQNINGETNALITGKSNVSANNVNVNAGKAKVALSKNGPELNDNDELEKGEEKDVNDKVSNLVINGVLSDQKSSEAVSASAAFGAAVNVQSIDRTIHSAIEDSIVNANNDVNVISSSITKTVDLAMGASFAGGKSMGKGAGAGAGEGANIGVGNADEIIDDAVSEAGSMDVNIGDVEDVANVNEQGDNALDALREGVNASSNQLSIAAVGSVNVLTDKTNTKSNITNSTINVGKNLNVKSSNDKFAVMGAGGIAKSGKIGGGAGVNVYTDKGSSKALIDGNSTVNFAKNNSSSNIVVSATNENTIYNVAAGVGIASDSSVEGVSGALGGSFAINTIKPTVEAMIIDSIVNGNSKTNVSLNTLGKVDIVDIAGGLSANNTKGLSIGASIASSVNLIKGNILSQISNSTLQYINDLSVIADAQNDLFTLDIAAALASSNTTSSFNFDGAVGVDSFENVISSKILGSTVDANGNVDVKALSTVKNTNSAGVAQYSGAQNPGLGVNGNVIVNIHRNILNTTVDKNSKIKAKNVSLLSKSIETSILTPVGFAISGRSTSMLAANVNYNLNKNDITSTLSGVINADNNVNVLAFDEATLYSRGGTLAFVNSGQSSGAVSGAVNIDKFKKNISAKIEDATINANNDVVVTAQSINSIGGTKKDDGSYDLPDITSSNYKDLVKSDGTGYKSTFENWNMFYSLAGGGKVSGGGTVIIKNIENTVSANVSNSTIKSKSLTAVADDYSIKNIVVGMVQALGDVAVGASVLIVQDKSTVSSVIDGGSDIEVKEDVNVIARNKKDNHFITAMLGFGTKGTGGANVVLTSSNDKTVAKIEGSSTKRTSVNANELNVKATTDTNSTNISFIGSGSSNFTFNIEPTVNNYKNETGAYINYGDIKNAQININAYDKTDLLNVLASISGAGEGFAGSGLILKNTNRNSIKGYIENSIIDTNKDINIDTNSVIDYSNWVVSGGFTGTGATLLVNFIINNVVSDLQAGIKNSEIKNSGNISILANKDVKDNLNNVAGSASITGQGLTAETNLIYNLYNNKITTYFDNVDANKISSLNLEAYANRDINNKNYGIAANGQGLSLLVDAIVNEVDSTVYSYVDAKDNTISSAGDINVIANDLTTMENQMAFVSIAGLGATIGANVNLVNANNTVKAEILSATGGSINARNINLDSKNILALKSTDVAVAGGFGAASIDILKITLGKRTGDFDELEKNNGTQQVVEDTLTKYAKVTKDDEVNGLYTSSASNAKTGAISRISGNVKTSNDVSVKAFSKLKGKDSETLKITNVPVSAGVVAVGVGVQSVEIANNTFAEISNANVTSSNGNVEVNSETKNDVSIVNTDVSVAGVAISGASGTYKNTSETISKIADSNVSANNVNVISKLSNKADIWDTAVIVSGASVGVAVSDATDLSKTIAMITGNTNIDAKGDLNVHATGSSDMSAVLRLTSISGAKLCSYIKNNATANTLTEAIIKDVNGNINTGNLNIIADLGTMSVLSRANVVSVSGLSYADIGKSGAYLTSTTTAGVDSKNTNLVINNKGTTNIKSGVKASDNAAVADLIATAKIMKTGVSMGGNIYASSSAIAENNATVNAYLLANEHNAENLNLIAKSNAIADAIVEVVDFGTALNVSSATLNSTLNNNLNVTVGGKNNIKQTANIIANNVSTNKTSMDFTPVGVLINVGTGTLNASLNSNTNVTLAGEYNSTLTNVDVRTVRHSILDLTSSSGSLISVANATATNNVGGDSVLNIDGFNSSSDSENRLNIITKTDNTLDTMTINNSGGFIAISNVNPTTSLNTSNTLNIKNSNINSQKDVNLSVENTNTVIDSASLKNGGFVAVAKTGITNTYTTNANLNIENSTINAKNVELSAKASTISGGDMLSYVGKGGGFVASTRFNVENNLNQNASIALKNSKVRARENLKVNLLTKTFFRQKTSTSAGGFTAAPVNSNTLTVRNTNKLSLDKDSLLKGDDKVLINFDSKDTLYAYSESYASHFGFQSPSSNSVIDLVINNELDNSGSIQGGESVEINTMKDSYSDLYQYAYSEANAAIPTTNESGFLSKLVNNAINISEGANITSGGDINIRYSAGSQSLFSKIAYKTVCRILFGIPITSTGSKSNISTGTRSIMNLDGEIVAGAGNMKYMKINRDGSVDFSTSTFNDDEYTLVDNRKITEDELREKDRISLNADINEIDLKIESIDTEINNTNEKISEVDSKIEANENALNELNKYKDNMKSEEEMSTIVEDNIKTKIIDSGIIDEEKYDSLTSAYDKKCSEIQQSNLEKMEKGQSDLQEIPSFNDFLKDQKDSLGISDDQLATINDACKVENAKIVSKKIADSEYIIYDDKILVLRDKENPITSLETENKALKDTKAEYEKIASSYDSEKTLMANKKDTLQKTLDDLPNKKYDVQDKEYSIIFNDVKNKSSLINISGINPSSISGNGNIRVASSGMKIDNYSNRSLIFSSIDLVSSYKSGLYINNENFSAFLNKPQAINNAYAYLYLRGIKSLDDVPTDGVHYISGYGSGEQSGITISNYYDNTNPFASSEIASDIFFTSSVKSNGELDVWNESGNIMALGDIDANKTSLIASKGEVISITTGDFKLKGSNNYIYGGKGISIFANNIDVSNVDMVAGTSSRDITITDDMLNDLIVDPTTGEKNMINLGSTKKSPYLNENNNIKAIYKNGEIYLFDIEQTGGEISLVTNGSVSLNPNGTYKTSEGYQTINITNETSKVLNVGSISNAKFKGGIYENLERLTDVGQNNVTEAGEVSISSIGNVNINKNIINNVILNKDNTYSQDNQNGRLYISSKNAITTNGEIRNSGMLSILSDDGEMNIAGNIYNNGYLSISKDGNGDAIISSSIIENSDGDLHISSSGSGDTRITSAIRNINGTLNITKYGNGNALISAIIENTNGDLNISNAGVGDLSILKEAVIALNKDNADKRGDITITNKAKTQGDLIIASEINNYGIGDVNISVEKDSSALLNIINNVRANDGNIKLSNMGDKGISIGNSVVEATKGDVIITNENGGINISSTGLINTKDGNITLTNNGNGGINLDGTINAEKQDVAINNTNGGVVISSTGKINTKDGNITLTNKGQNGITLDGTINAEKQDVTIDNTNGGIAISSTGKINTKDGNITLANNGQGGISVDGTINADNKNIEINNEFGGVNVAGLINANNGNIALTNNGENISLSGKINSELGNISLINTNGGVVISSTGLINTKDGNITLTNKGQNGITLDGTINAEKQDVTIDNTNGGIAISSTGKINTKDGNITLANNGQGGISVDGTVNADNKNIEINNELGGVNVAGLINANNGNIALTNNGENISLSGKINSELGNISLINTNGGVTVSEAGLINTKDGNITLTNNGNGGINLDGTINAEKQDIIINNENDGINISSTGSINTKDGNISLTNKGQDGIDIKGTINSYNKNIDITNELGGVNVAGLINTKDGNITLTNNGNGGINLDGTINAEKQDVTINNTNGGVVISSTGLINTKDGNINLTNNGQGGISVDGTVNADNKNIEINNELGGVNVAGLINANNGNIALTNYGENISLSGKINSELGNISLINTNGGVTVSGAGLINTKDGNITLTNNGNGGINLDGTINAEKQDVAINNTNGGVTVSETGLINTKDGNIKLTNNGQNGISVDGTINADNKNIDITNELGGVNVAGLINANNGNIALTNNGENISLSGKINSELGNISLINTNGGVVISSTGLINTKDGNITLTNNGNGGINLDGTINAEKQDVAINNTNGGVVISSTGKINTKDGNINLTNNGQNGIDVKGTINSYNKNIDITNELGGVNVTGLINTKDGNITLTNNGNGGINLDGTINAEKQDVTINNTNGGIAISSTGLINTKDGNITLTNKGQNGITLDGTINADNKNIEINNEFGGVNVAGLINANNGNIALTNNGENISLSGKINSELGNISLINTNGGVTVSETGLINTKDGNITLTNNGQGGISVDGTVNADNKNIEINNEFGGVNVAGLINANNGNIALTNNGENISLSGKINSELGNISLINTNGGVTVSETGLINTKDGNITLTNNGNGGINLDGTINADNKNIEINNEFGGVNVAGLINTKDGNITLTNNGNGGINLDGTINAEKQDVTINNTNGGLAISSTGLINTKDGNITLANKGQNGISVGGTVNADNKNIEINNELGGVNVAGLINANNGNIALTNNGENISLSGKINSELGNISLINTNGGVTISETGLINTKDGNITLTNKGQNGINIKGIIKADNKNILLNNENSNIVIGEYESDNDSYIQTLNGDIVINQTNGNILNGVIDAVSGNNHSSHDLNNPNKAYKTLISSKGNLTLNVIDGNIGESKLDSPAFSIDAKTRDYTDSINVNVEGLVIAKALNKNSNAKRLINLRAKDSDLSIKRIEADGDVVLTAIDWKQGDLRPTPKNDDYYKGYSILSYSDFNQPAIIGQNISLIASDNIGTSYKPLTYLQDTLNAPNSSLSAEAENNIYLDSRVNSSNPAKIYQLISKRGNVDLNFDIDMEISSIVSGKNLHIISTAKNLTIYEIGNIDSEMLNFEDVLYPHDNILATSKEHCIPESIDIEVLDINGGDNANSTLKIYTAFVKGRNNGRGAYYEDDGTRMADIFLMADNIYANSDKASSGVASEREYSEGVFGGDSSKMIKAKGINAYGDGAILSIDVRGVNKELVEVLYPSASRTNYNEQLQVQSPFSKFLNKYALIDDINYVDNRANNIVLSVNDYMGSNRNVQINTIIADNAFVNTASDVLNINEGYVEHFGEFKNSTKLAIIDNDNRKIYDNADIQLYTAKTGSFNLFMNKSIDINTTAGTVNRKPNILVNGYHSAWTLVERCQKESKNADDRIDMKQAKNKNSDTVMNTKSLAKGTKVEQNSKLTSDTQILNISSTGAIVKDNGKMKVGKYSTLIFNIDDEDVVVKVKVESSDNGFVNVRFVDVPEEVINKILYMNMLKAENK